MARGNRVQIEARARDEPTGGPGRSAPCLSSSVPPVVQPSGAAGGSPVYQQEASSRSAARFSSASRSPDALALAPWPDPPACSIGEAHWQAPSPTAASALPTENAVPA